MRKKENNIPSLVLEALCSEPRIFLRSTYQNFQNYSQRPKAAYLQLKTEASSEVTAVLIIRQNLDSNDNQNQTKHYVTTKE